MFKKLIGLIRKYNTSSNIIINIDKVLDFKIRANYLLNLALTSSKSIIRANETGETELIVSFTTYDKRIHDVHLVIESIAGQTVKPNRFILWLDENEFTLETIPLILHQQIDRGLEIRFCPNYRSYKKLIPTLQHFPDANVITIDDDLLYPHDMIEILCKEHKQYPKCIIGNRAHKITFESDGKVSPYRKWEHETLDSNASHRIIAIGVGGVFYPARTLNNECLNIEHFTKFSPHADDVWFKAMSLLNNIKCKKVNDDRVFFERFLLLENSQDIALCNSNLLEDGNDPQIKSVFEYYNLYKRL
jgi:hypothetical protein